MNASRTIVGVLVLLYAGFWLWYGGRGEPLTASETESYLAQLDAAAAARGVHESEVVASFRDLLRGDDGDEFYMINLMRFREKAVYPEGHDYDDDVRAAADRYSAAVVPALLRRGSVPILVADVTGGFLSPEGADAWDQVGIVRYRSRRDMLEMAVELARGGGGVHKWASIEKTHVFPAKRIVDLVFVRGAVAVLLLAVGLIAVFLLRRRAYAVAGGQETA